MTASKRTLIGATLLLAIAGAPALADPGKQFSGIAAYYDKDYRGRTASGTPYDASQFTAAHKTLPFGTRVRVTDPRSQRSVVVVINDRGPFTKGRVIDLSLAAAKELRMIERGLLHVTAEIEAADTTTLSGHSAR